MGRQSAMNTFNGGMNTDLNPLTTPKDVLTDCLNGTIITYNGNEFVLQNDMGNCKVERAKLSPGFIPLGMQEYGGIVYVASYNPIDNRCEIGSFPSPERDFSTSDFENLEPSKFLTSQFLLPTALNNPEVTTVISKLFEPELMQLHPGDKYVIVYTINNVVPGSTSPSEIDDQTKYDQFISRDDANRKLFKLKFYRISDNNNLSEIKPADIKVISDPGDVENEYVYFKENTQGVIAASLELEQLDMFDANVIDTSKRSQELKKVTIEAIGSSASMNSFEGVRVDVKLPTPDTFYIRKTSTNKKVKADVGDLVANSLFECSVTPFSKYQLFPKLKQDFRVELGKFASNGTGVNNIFRYKVTDTYAQIDFDFKFETDSVDDPHLYVELYDPWSDYSVVKVVDTATFYGVNSVIIDLVSEPTQDVFNLTTWGGTPTGLLAVNTDTTYDKTMLPSGNLKRTNVALRKNHFYIVRISNVEKVEEDGVTTYIHNDFYKAMYTNQMLNTAYDLLPGAVSYKEDFNTIPFDVQSIYYDMTKSKIGTVNDPDTVTEIGTDKMTGGKYYKIATSSQSLANYKYIKHHSVTSKYKLDFVLKGVDNLFGNFKSSLLTLAAPTLSNSAGAGLKPLIEDVGWNSDPNIAPNTVGDWSLADNSVGANKSYVLTTNLKTDRSVYATQAQSTPTAKTYSEIPLTNALYHSPTQSGPRAENKYAKIYKTGKYDMYMVDNVGTTRHIINGWNIDESDLWNAIMSVSGVNKYSFFMIYIDNGDYENSPARTSFEGAPGTYSQRCAAGRDWQVSIIGIRDDVNSVINLLQGKGITNQLEAFSDLFVASNATITSYVVSAATPVSANTQTDTKAMYPDISFTSTLTPDSAKTYLSTFKFKAVNPTSMVDFSAANLNAYIATRLGSSNIIDGKNAIADAFIPSITANKTVVSTQKIDDLSISKSADNAIIDLMQQGLSNSADDPFFIPSSNQHGKIYSRSGAHTNFASKLKVVGFNSTTPIDLLNNCYITINNPAEDTYIGKAYKHCGSTATSQDFANLYRFIDITGG